MPRDAADVATRKHPAQTGVQCILATIPGGRCKGFFTLDKRPNSLDFPAFPPNLDGSAEQAAAHAGWRREYKDRKDGNMKNWQLGAILAAVAVIMYGLFWLNMTTR